MARKKKWESAIRNNNTYQMWLNYFRNIAINVYHWEGLPDTVDQRFLELTLLDIGYALYFQDPVINCDLALRCSISGNWDVYNTPLKREAYATNNYRCKRDITNSVLIYNNYLHQPTAYLAREYALRIYDIDRTIDVNVRAQKTPILINATEEQRLTLKNLYMQYDGNEPFIFADKNANLDGLSVIQTGAPFVAAQLFQLKQFYMNEFFSLLGIENSNQDKKAQMTANEIGANYGQIEASRFTGLMARQEAAKKINNMFGTNISVKVSSNLDTLVNRPFMGLTPGDNALIRKDIAFTEEPKKYKNMEVDNE